jgi:hypothetical protein
MASFFLTYCPEGISSKYRLIVCDEDGTNNIIPLTVHIG